MVVGVHSPPSPPTLVTGGAVDLLPTKIALDSQLHPNGLTVRVRDGGIHAGYIIYEGDNLQVSATFGFTSGTTDHTHDLRGN